MDKDFTNCCSVRGFCAKGCGRQDKQLNTYDYLAGIPGNENSSDLVEVQFKHTRKGYYRNDNHLPLEKGDMVAVEATPGHDIGVVTLTGQLVPLQMKKANLKPGVEIKRIYRKARPADLEKYEESKALEQDTMIRSRKIAKDLDLNMKIGDVEYQGDGNKAIFYYIADARVDFRQLIKVLADAFHVRIEMKQIGARQEAGRIGGIGPCGRELCCATWMKNFNSVSTTAARFQDISPNPQKLAGQCAKLKCCLNYEVDTYVEASKKIPPRDVVLETADATYYLFKTDILAGQLTYSTDKRMAANLVTISADRAQAIIKLNKSGEKPASLDDTVNAEPERPVDLVEQEDLHRFDKSKRRNKNANNKKKNQSAEVKKEGKSKDGELDKNSSSGAAQPTSGTSNDVVPKASRGKDSQVRQKGSKEKGNAETTPKVDGKKVSEKKTNTNNKPRGERGINFTTAKVTNGADLKKNEVESRPDDRSQSLGNLLNTVKSVATVQQTRRDSDKEKNALPANRPVANGKRKNEKALPVNADGQSVNKNNAPVNTKDVSVEKNTGKEAVGRSSLSRASSQQPVGIDNINGKGKKNDAMNSSSSVKTPVVKDTKNTVDLRENMAESGNIVKEEN